METHFLGNRLVFTGIGPFNPARTFTCGQCFRFVPGTNGGFFGVAGGRAVTVTGEDDRLEICPALPGDEGFWANYFALDVDYAALNLRLGKSPPMARALACAGGIRVLRQDFFEMLITFIFSQNNNIPRITALVNRLCRLCGQPLPGGVYAFPTPAAVAALTQPELESLRAGWRAAYLAPAARAVLNGLSARSLAGLSLPRASAALEALPGVGPKVAACVLLFGCGRWDAVPMDVWMKRAMAAVYPRGFPKYMAPRAGIAQQYLFYWARQNLPKGGDGHHFGGRTQS